MKKICWIDVETSGIDCKKNCIIQLAALADIDGKVVEEFHARMRPDSKHVVEDEALKVNNTTREMLSTFPSQAEAYKNFIFFLTHHIDKYDRSDKFIFAAYNASFDDDFLRAFFVDNHNKYYGSYFFWPKLDMQAMIALEILKGTQLENYRLATVCKHYNISIDAHDALSDIRATRELFLTITGRS